MIVPDPNNRYYKVSVRPNGEEEKKLDAQRIEAILDDEFKYAAFYVEEITDEERQKEKTNE
jgi:hypothetical protein